MNFLKEHNRGLIGATVIHLLLLFILIWVNLDPAEPTFPDPDGIVIDFGNTETGSGNEEPSPAATPEVQQEETVEETVEPEETQPTTEPEQEIIEDPVKDPVVTQDIEDAPSMEEIAEKKRKEEEKQKLIAEENKRKKEEEQKRIEEERKKQEEAKRIAEEKKKKEEEQKRIAAINNRTQGLFGSNGTGTESQGEAGGDGNQGKPDGQIGANNYKGGGEGNGIDWSLSGRSVIALPQPNKGIQSAGKVVVEIIVDREGNVISALPGAKGSTTMDSRLLEAAKKAAIKAKFNVSTSAAERQKGTVTYIFELQ